jgi:hypothetical protein
MIPLRFTICAVVLTTLAAPPVRAADSSVDFLRDVRPILSSHCFKCHGPDEETRKGKLRLDLRDNALKGGKSGDPGIVPGQPDKSTVITRLFSKDEDEIMPPAKVKHPLADAQKDVLKRWVAAGAEYRPHWAFVAPRQGEVPKVPRSVISESVNSNQSGGAGRAKPPTGSLITDSLITPVNPIDAFILARLARENLKPSPAADPLTLVRRAYLDLIGLPPTPEEADAFVSSALRDPHSAFDTLVDQLLASPHYGERWARKWLDLARYADSNGYEKDRNRSIWPYRDWVIRALNTDMPFDQFTIEQIAGDLLPPGASNPKPQPSNLSPLIATGFHRNTMLNEEGGIDPLEFRFHAVVDRVSTTGTAWLGLTVGCAQCHTHKYDPILHREYYQMMAFLNNADEPDLDLPEPDAAEQQTKRAQRAAKLLAELPSKWPVNAESLRWETAKLTLDKAASANGAQPDSGKILDDGSVLFAAPGPDRTDVTVSFTTTLTNITSLRLEALTDDSLPSKGPGRTEHGNFVLSEITVSTAPLDGSGAPQPRKIRSAKASAEQEKFPISNAFDGHLETGWAIHDKRKPLNANQSATFEFSQPFGVASGTKVTVRLQQNYGNRHTIGRVRLSVGAPSPDQRPIAARRDEAVEKAFAQWLARERARNVQWTALRPTEAKANMPLLTIRPDASVLASGDITKSDTYDLAFANAPARITAIRLEALPDDSLPAHGPGLAYYEGPKGDFFLGEFKVSADGQPVKFSKATESYAKNNFGGGSSARAATDGDPQTGWSCAGRPGEAHEAVFIPEAPIGARRLDVQMMFGRHYACSLGRFRISVSGDANAAAREMPEELATLLALPNDKLSADQRAKLREHFLLTAPELEAQAKEIRNLRRPAAHTTTLVMRERPASNPRPTFIHNRGEFLQPRDAVEPGVPSFLPSLPKDAPKTRLAFARWLVSTENPLTARVVVNRQWAAFFGQGIVRTQNDFGFQGDLPTHPELLDWLAVEFVKQGWSLKKLHRLIVTSATYRQSSRVTPELLERDPENRLLARGPRVRLEAEIVRDAALKASGTLSEKMFGPPVKPAQPAGVTEVAYGSPKWDVSIGEDAYRRSLYTFIKRSAPFAMFNTFDAPSGETCVAKREVSNTPLQSLTLLNDVAFVEAAQKLGALTVAQKGDDEAKVRFAFRRALTRPPQKVELEKLITFLQAQRARLKSGELKPADLADEGKGDAVERAAWTTVARVVLNLDETITKQ